MRSKTKMQTRAILLVYNQNVRCINFNMALENARKRNNNKTIQGETRVASESIRR
jgi:hypothetical protein